MLKPVHLLFPFLVFILTTTSCKKEAAVDIDKPTATTDPAEVNEEKEHKEGVVEKWKNSKKVKTVEARYIKPEPDSPNSEGSIWIQIHPRDESDTENPPVYQILDEGDRRHKLAMLKSYLTESAALNRSIFIRILTSPDCTPSDVSALENFVEILDLPTKTQNAK